MFLINKSKHIENSKNCEECCLGYPLKCTCGGFLHCQFVREDYKGVIEYAKKCDKCGDDWFVPLKTRKKR